MNKVKEYNAFISYKREDEKWAKCLANELEHYHLPTTLNGKDLPKNLRPVFRDVDELMSGNLDPTGIPVGPRNAEISVPVNNKKKKNVKFVVCKQ